MQTLRRRSAVGLCRPAWLRGPVSLRWPMSFRLAAASIALFAMLGIGHVLPALHFALVAHRICAEHGELLHEAAPQPPAESRSSTPEESSWGSARAAQPAVVAGGHAGHEHDHCGVLALPDSFGTAPSAAWREPVAPGEPVACASPGERPAHVGIALLLRAPKRAPPA